jgi:hypothetical protein
MMALEIRATPEPFSEEVAEAVRSALGARIEAGDWLLLVQRRPGFYVVDLTNRNGVMRQWFLEPGDPVVMIIREALGAPS